MIRDRDAVIADLLRENFKLTNRDSDADALIAAQKDIIAMQQRTIRKLETQLALTSTAIQIATAGIKRINAIRSAS